MTMTAAMMTATIIVGMLMLFINFPLFVDWDLQWKSKMKLRVQQVLWEIADLYYYYYSLFYFYLNLSKSSGRKLENISENWKTFLSPF